MSIEDELMDAIAKDISKEIDEGIMATMLVETGWTPVKYFFKSNKDAVDINIWLSDNCKSEWGRYGSDYLFADVKEAEWFILRWL